jgi:hypothetical protein
MAMARVPRERRDAADIAEETHRGWKAVDEASLAEAAAPYSDSLASAYDAAAQAADAVLPSQDELRAKYLGAAAGAADSLSTALSASDAAAEAADITLVKLEGGPLKKTVAVSKSQKKVLWSQG